MLREERNGCAVEKVRRKEKNIKNKHKKCRNSIQAIMQLLIENIQLLICKILNLKKFFRKRIKQMNKININENCRKYYNRKNYV